MTTALTSDRLGTFPFGEPLLPVVQADQGPKDTFVLGVYASAVHATWRDANGQPLVKALVVASEPCIFWDGEGAEEIVGRIPVPREAGSLVSAEQRYNGPSGRALDEMFLNPLGLDRSRTWMCDLVPHCCANPSQVGVFEERYLPVARRLGLPEPSMPTVPWGPVKDARRNGILDEIRRSRATTLITLGDKPLNWFVRFFAPRWKRLSDFGTSADAYGRHHRVRLDDVEINLLPLVHPRQAAQLGKHVETWTKRHAAWMDRVSSER
jgi:hypothetical protein